MEAAHFPEASETRLRPRAEPSFLQSATIALACWLVYLPALHGTWLWDDTSDVADNYNLRSLEGLLRLWTAPDGPDYFPLKDTLRWIQWHLWGDHVLGYHLTSLGLHFLAAILLCRLLARWNVRSPWLGGLLFAVHPLAVESVAWIAELKNTLSLPFLLGSMICYVDGEAGRLPASRRKAYFLSLALFVAAMLCKTSVAMFPVLILLYSFWKEGRIEARAVRAAAPFFAVSLVLGAVTYFFQKARAIGHLDLDLGGPLSRIAMAGHALAFYAGKFLWPSSLLPIYARWPSTEPKLSGLLVWAVIFGGIAWLATRSSRIFRAAAFGLSAFVISLIPVLGFIPMSFLYLARVADHLAYLPLAILCGLAGAGLGEVLFRMRKSRSVGFAGVGILTVLLLLAARDHARAFDAEIDLWSLDLASVPDSWAAENNLGCALSSKGKIQEAMVHLGHSISLNPGYPQAHLNLGRALAETHHYTEAEAEFRKALALEPDFAEAHFDLARLLTILNRSSEAVPHFEESIRISPRHAEVHDYLGTELSHLGRQSEAIKRFREAVELDPSTASYRNNLGVSLANAGRYPEALDELSKGIALDPGNADLKANRDRIAKAADESP